MIKVVIRASLAVVRSGLAAMLSQSTMQGDARFQLLPDAPGNGADVLLVEIDEHERLERALQAAASSHPGAALVLLADTLTRSELRRALNSGARAVLGRDASSAELIAAIEASTSGLTVLSAEQMDVLLPSATRESELPGEPLTPREAEILTMMAEGLGNKEIASRLNISGHTVKFHVSSILAKFGVTSRTEAVSRGVREGLLLL